jgi:FkbM family methyltransferase
VQENDPDLCYVAGRHGRFIVNRHDCYVSMSLVAYGEYSEAEWQFIRRFLSPGMVVMDIGANIGAFTVPMAKSVGQVLAFEPQPYAYELLRANIRLNQLENVSAFPFGLSSAEEQREAELPVYSQTGNFGGVCFLNTGKGLQAGFKRMDDVFKGPRLDFVKIDVEGMEPFVLRGGSVALKGFRPVLYVENHPGERSPALIHLLLDMGYRLWWHTPHYFNPDNYLKQSQNFYDGQLSVNMICLPVEQLDRLALVPPGLLPVSGPEHDLRKDGKIIISVSEEEKAALLLYSKANR